MDGSGGTCVLYIHTFSYMHKDELAKYNAYLDSPLACQRFFLPRQAWERQSLVLILRKKSVQAGTRSIRRMGAREEKKVKLKKTGERDREKRE